MSEIETTYIVTLARNPETFQFAYKTEQAARAGIEDAQAEGQWLDAQLSRKEQEIEDDVEGAFFFENCKRVVGDAIYTQLPLSAGEIA